MVIILRKPGSCIRSMVEILWMAMDSAAAATSATNVISYGHSSSIGRVLGAKKAHLTRLDHTAATGAAGLPALNPFATRGGEEGLDPQGQTP